MVQAEDEDVHLGFGEEVLEEAGQEGELCGVRVVWEMSGELGGRGERREGGRRGEL